MPPRKKTGSVNAVADEAKPRRGRKKAAAQPAVAQVVEGPIRHVYAQDGTCQVALRHEYTTVAARPVRVTDACGRAVTLPAPATAETI